MVTRRFWVITSSRLHIIFCVCMHFFFGGQLVSVAIPGRPRMISLLLAASAFSSRPSLPQDPPQQLTAQKERLIDQLLPEETPKRFYWNDGNDEYHDGYGWDLRDDDEIRIDGGIIAEGDDEEPDESTKETRCWGPMCAIFAKNTKRQEEVELEVSGRQQPTPPSSYQVQPVLEVPPLHVPTPSMLTPTGNPGEVRISPAELQISPGEVRISPSEVKTSPGEVQTSPGEVQI